MNIVSSPLWIVVALALLCGCAHTSTKRPVSSDDKRKIAELNTQIAIQHMRERDFELALKKLEKAIDADPGYADAYNASGIVYSQLGETEKAEENFRRSLRIDGDNPLTLNNYGQFLCRRGDHEKGEEMFLAATANPLYRNPGVAFSNAGTCALAANDVPKAEKYFRKALEKDPRIAAALLSMAKITFDSDRFLPARAYLQRYSEVAPQTAASLWLGVRVERELGDRDAEASYALALEKNFPDSEEVRQLFNADTP